MHPDNSDLADGYFKQIGIETVSHLGVDAIGKIKAGQAQKALDFIQGYKK